MFVLDASVCRCQNECISLGRITLVLFGEKSETRKGEERLKMSTLNKPSPEGQHGSNFMMEDGLCPPRCEGHNYYVCLHNPPTWGEGGSTKWL